MFIVVAKILNTILKKSSWITVYVYHKIYKKDIEWNWEWASNSAYYAGILHSMYNRYSLFSSERTQKSIPDAMLERAVFTA